MKLHSPSLGLLLAIFCGSAALLAKPTAAGIAEAGTLAAQIKTPAVRAALQCRVAFEDTTATVPIKDRSDMRGAGAFWAAYLKRLRSIDVAGCPDDFKSAFERHLRTVKSVADSLNNPSARLAPNPNLASNTSYVARPHFEPAAPVVTQVKGHHDALGDCGETYKEVFAVANKSMKTLPPGDGQLAGQIEGLLKD